MIETFKQLRRDFLANVEIYAPGKCIFFLTPLPEFPKIQEEKMQIKPIEIKPPIIPDIIEVRKEEDIQKEMTESLHKIIEELKHTKVTDEEIFEPIVKAISTQIEKESVLEVQEISEMPSDVTSDVIETKQSTTTKPKDQLTEALELFKMEAEQPGELHEVEKPVSEHIIEELKPEVEEVKEVQSVIAIKEVKEDIKVSEEEVKKGELVEKGLIMGDLVEEELVKEKEIPELIKIPEIEQKEIIKKTEKVEKAKKEKLKPKKKKVKPKKKKAEKIKKAKKKKVKPKKKKVKPKKKKIKVKKVKKEEIKK
ncbi:MAG: hypothetical protein ACTSR3_20010, partial [Candidatus Helarchaeota archaeon]